MNCQPTLDPQYAAMRAVLARAHHLARRVLPLHELSYEMGMHRSLFELADECGIADDDRMRAARSIIDSAAKLLADIARLEELGPC